MFVVEKTANLITNPNGWYRKRKWSIHGTTNPNPNPIHNPNTNPNLNPNPNPNLNPNPNPNPNPYPSPDPNPTRWYRRR